MSCKMNFPSFFDDEAIFFENCEATIFPCLVSVSGLTQQPSINQRGDNNENIVTQSNTLFGDILQML